MPQFISRDDIIKEQAGPCIFLLSQQCFRNTCNSIRYCDSREIFFVVLFDFIDPLVTLVLVLVISLDNRPSTIRSENSIMPESDLSFGSTATL